MKRPWLLAAAIAAGVQFGCSDNPGGNSGAVEAAREEKPEPGLFDDVGPDSDRDGLPDDWEWLHFGFCGPSATGDYDGDGMNNGQEYRLGTDPNSIAFDLCFLEQYTSSSTATGEVTIVMGVPFKVTVLVDSTNLATATWSAFTTNPVANLGMVQGWHDILVGVRGHCEASPPMWSSVRVKLVTDEPGIVITEPAPGVVSVPMLQILGFSPRPLLSIRYDMSNALTVLRDEPGFGTRKHYDKSIGEFTTTSFQLFDVELAPGTNAVTVRVTDWAGNVSSTNLTYVFDSSSDRTPPVAELIWPQDGSQLSTDEFFARGTVDDPTATVVAEFVNRNGTNVVEGLVERNGTFWVENLVATPGTNLLTMTFTDAAGNRSVTVLNLIRVRLDLTIDMEGVDPGEIMGGRCRVSGTVSDSSYSVWVNGIPAVVDPDGTWTAEEVPTSGGGTAVFKATAYPTGQQPEGTSSQPQNAEVDGRRN